MSQNLMGSPSLWKTGSLRSFCECYSRCGY